MNTITRNDFLAMLYDKFFEDKDPTCSFEVSEEQDMFDCEKDIPVVKMGYAQVFQRPIKVVMKEEQAAKPKRRWRSKSPVKKKKKRRRWRSRSYERTRWR